jgi:ribosomal protein S18 acetylase RimI-like enzyme
MSRHGLEDRPDLRPGGRRRRTARADASCARAHTLPAVFRLSSRADPAFLAEMLYEVVNWRDDGAEERPPLDELLARPELRRYVEDWGRVGDVAIVALDRLNEPVGAAWYRQFSAEKPGYGFVAADVPELALAVYPECRGQRVGSLLLGTIVSRARAGGYRSISLSVAADNPARRLYVRHGFEVASPADDEAPSLTMVLELE